jgi:hypothetical protein
MTRRVAARTTQGEGEVWPGSGLMGTIFLITMVYEDTGEPADVMADHEALAITGYMVKLRPQFHNCGDVVPMGGLVREIDDTHVVLDDVRLQRELFLQLYTPD